MTIHDLNPQCVWKNFYALTQIPHPSKHEEKISKFLYQWGKDLGLESFRDEVGNVIIRKPATKGMEKCKGIVLQAHMDMVPQKNNDKKHDFTKDPIETVVKEKEDGLWLYANGTTLGADDGLGVAAAMAVLESKELKHGPVEALFTVDEETGMNGAFALKGGLLQGDILINLDSETEGELYVGCAGGVDWEASVKFKEEPMPKGYKAFKIIAKGLRGGHSGMEINEGRGNASKFVIRALLPMLRDMDCKLVSIDGGNLKNAIPREAEAVIAVPADAVDDVKKVVEETDAVLRKEYGKVEKDFTLFIEPAKAKTIVAGNTGLKFIKCLYVVPDGVDRMSLEMEGLVESSNNLAIVKTEKGKFVSSGLMRGATDSIKYDQAEALRCAFELAGGKVVFEGAYSGWAPNLASPILKTMKEQYKKLYKVEPAVMAIHAGLECGILGSVYTNWDMVSCGPTLKSPHSPDERCYIPSVEKWWNFLVAALANAPKK